MGRLVRKSWSVIGVSSVKPSPMTGPGEPGRGGRAVGMQQARSKDRSSKVGITTSGRIGGSPISPFLIRPKEKTGSGVRVGATAQPGLPTPFHFPHGLMVARGFAGGEDLEA